MRFPPMLCVTGPSGSGKTRLLERLIRDLKAAGLRVAAVKHCGHIDLPSNQKDSERLALAGAEPAIASSAEGVVLHGPRVEPLLLDLIAAFAPQSDLVLLEGYRRSTCDKIVVAAGAGPHGGGENLESVQLVVGESNAALMRPQGSDALARWVIEWYEQRRAQRGDLLGVVLNGGAGRRMGSDKADLRLRGARVLATLCELLADRLGGVMVVGREPKGVDMPACVPWYPDDRPGLGPLAGIATALRLAAAGGRAKGILVVACDMPAVDGPLVEHLLSGRDPRRGQATVAVNGTTGRLEPLFGVYEAHARDSIEKSLDASSLSVSEWCRRSEVKVLPVPQAMACGLVNVNTPDDLRGLEGRHRRATP